MPALLCQLVPILQKENSEHKKGSRSLPRGFFMRPSAMCHSPNRDWDTVLSSHHRSPASKAESGLCAFLPGSPQYESGELGP